LSRIITKRKIGFLILIIASIIIFVWNFSSLNSILKRKIIEDIYKASKGTILLEAKHLGIGPGYISIDSVYVKNETEKTQFYLNIGRIKIYFRIWPLFIFKTSLPDLLTGVVLEQPEFLVYLKPEQNSTGGETNLENYIKLEKFFTINEHLPSFRLEQARFNIFNDDEQWISFSDLNGYLMKNKNGNVEARISDKRATQSSLKIRIVYNPENGFIQNRIHFSHYSVSGLHLLQLDNPVQLNKGYLTGTFQIQSFVRHLDSLKIGGRINIKSMEGSLYGKFFSCDSVLFAFSDDRFETMASPLIIGSNEIEWALNGRIKPALSVKGFFQSYDFDVSTLNYYLPPEDSMKGVVRLTGIFSYGPKKFLKTSFTSQRIYFKTWSQENVFGQVILRDSLIHLRAGTQNHVYKFSSDVEYGLKSKILKGSFEGEYLLNKNIPILSGIDSSWIRFRTEFAGDLRTRNASGRIQMEIQNNELEGFYPQGSFRYANHQIKLELEDSSQNPPLSLNLEISDLNKKPLIRILELYNFPLEKFFNKKYIKYVPQNMLVSFYMAGVIEFLQGKIRIFKKDTGDELLEFSGKAENLFTRYASFKGALSFYSYNKEIKGRTFIASQPEKWHGFFYLGDFLKADLLFEQASGEPGINLNINVDHLKLTSLTASLDTLKWNGILNSRITLKGPLSDPVGTFQANLEDAILNGVGYVDFDVFGHYAHSTLSVDSLAGKLNNVAVVQGNLSADFSSYEIHGDLKGAGVELYNLSELVFGNRDLIKGNTNYFIQVGPGEKGLPEITLHADIFDGEFFNESVPEMHLDIKDSLSDWNPFAKNVHNLRINQLEWISSLGYTGKIKGEIPFRPEREMQLAVDLKGNVLAHLKRIIPFITKIDVDGYLTATITGTKEEPRLGNLELEIVNGTAEFERVLKPLHRIRAYITKRKDNPFVHIHRLEGFFENSFAHIHNEPSVTLANGKKLLPWNFEGINLNFGTLILQTVKTGIPLNIPGLQEEGDFGYFAVKGQNEKEEFYFSGPPDHPVIRGMVIGRNARVTFPFLATPEANPEKPNRVVDFLMAVNWDVQAIADKGMYYFVDIPAYVGKVYMELNVDINSPGLHFIGTLNDESFRVDGEVFSYKGHVEYLETNFRVEKFGAVFNRHELFPEVYGRAFTTVRDSLNIPHEVYLQLYAIDPETKQEVQRGRWEDFRFKLVSNEPIIGDNQELVLAQMGYSVQNLSSKVTEVGSQLTENLLIRPLIRPFERFLEKRLNLDYVRFRSAIAKNLMNYSLGNQFKWWNRENSLILYNPYLSPDPTFILLQSSELTLGKYLERNLYMSYTMQLMAMYESVDLHVNQRLNLEYRLMKNFLLELEYDYFKYNQYRFIGYDKPYDFIIRLRHSFNF
jgi:hypothetical protein